MTLNAVPGLDLAGIISAKTGIAGGDDANLGGNPFASLLSSVLGSDTSQATSKLSVELQSGLTNNLEPTIPGPHAERPLSTSDLKLLQGLAAHPLLKDVDAQTLEGVQNFGELLRKAGVSQQSANALLAVTPDSESHSEELFALLKSKLNNNSQIGDTSGESDLQIGHSQGVALQSDGPPTGTPPTGNTLQSVVQEIITASQSQATRQAQNQHPNTIPALLDPSLQVPISGNSGGTDSGIIQTVASGGNQISDEIQKLLNSKTQNSPEAPPAQKNYSTSTEETAPKINPDRNAAATPLKHPVIKTIVNAVTGQSLIISQENGSNDKFVPIQSTTATTSTVQLSAPLNAQTQAPELPINMIAVHIAKQAQNGAKRFDIRLDPPELGRVHVRLDVSREGQVNTHLVVERSETLDLFQRDARTLERALTNAGLDMSKDGLSFSLKDQGSAQQDMLKQSNQDQNLKDRLVNSAEDEAENQADDPEPNYYVSSSGLDIKI